MSDIPSPQVLRAKVAASTVWEILNEAGIELSPRARIEHLGELPAPQANLLLACDVFETATLSGARHYVFAVIEHPNRRIRPLGATPHPTGPRVVQSAGVEVVLSGVRIPRMNSITERWVRTADENHWTAR